MKLKEAPNGLNRPVVETRLAPPPTLVSAVVDHVKAAILRGEFLPGSALPEVPLSRDLATSRSTIREALRTLAELGLVELHPRRGATVSSLSPQRAREIFSLRAVLEAFAVRLALTEGKIRRLELETIEAAFQHMRRCAERGDPFALIEADMALHWAICRPSGHELLLDQLNGLQAQTRQFIFYTKVYDSDAESEVTAHTPLLQAVRSAEADRAEAAMRDHITNAGERLLVRMLENRELAASAPDHDRL